MEKVTNLDQAHDLIKESLKNVIQELIIIDKDGEHHMVYIHCVGVDENGQLAVDFSTPSNSDHVYPYLVDALTLQIKQIAEEHRQNKRYNRLWRKIWRR